MPPNFSIASVVAGTVIVLLTAGHSHAQKKDSVFLFSGSGEPNSVVRGKIVETSPFVVTVDVDGNQQQIANHKIRKINFADAPRGLERAQVHFENQWYDDCIDALKKIEEPQDSKFVQQEIQFLDSCSFAKKSLRGDPAATPAEAESRISKFIKAHSDTRQMVLAVDVYGQLLMANGKTQQAQKEFNRLTKSNWERYVVRGYFFEAETLMHQEKYDAAFKSLKALVRISGSSDESRQFNMLATCQLAKIAARRGDVDNAIQTIQKIIKDENSDNTQLFAYAYNALGTCYLESNELKKACRAFLHTDLLFSTEADAHAEALFQLTKIWPQLQQTDRANRAREMLTSRYRSTIWNTKL